MLRSRVPATAAFVAISLEVLAAWPVILVAAGWLVWRYAPAWWSTAGPQLATAAQGAWPWVLLVTLVSVAACRYARRIATPALPHVRRPVRRTQDNTPSKPHSPHKARHSITTMPIRPGARRNENTGSA